jgi:hypothetical protein
MAVSAWGALTAANTVRPGCYISAWVTTIGATAVSWSDSPASEPLRLEPITFVNSMDVQRTHAP